MTHQREQRRFNNCVDIVLARNLYQSASHARWKCIVVTLICVPAKQAKCSRSHYIDPNLYTLCFQTILLVLRILFQGSSANALTTGFPRLLSVARPFAAMLDFRETTGLHA